VKIKLIKKYKGKTATFKEVEVKIRGKKFKGNILEFPKTVAILPLIRKNEIILVRQYRFPPQRSLWEIPAGKLGKKENPEKGAKRELREETGFSAQKLEKIAEFYLSPGYSTEYMYLFLAKNLQKGRQNLSEDEEILEVRTFKLKEAFEMIKSGKIKDLKTMFALFYLFFYLT